MDLGKLGIKIDFMKKILVTGGSGMVGKHLKDILPEATYLSSKDYNLTLEKEVSKMFYYEKPDIIIHLAAKVGGIVDNINKPAEYYTNNVLMNTLLLEYARFHNVEKFIGVLSTCVYPDDSMSYPMSEYQLHEGPPTKTNFSYAIAKRGLAVQIDAYKEQYGTNYNYIIPCNLYSEYDKFNENSHFVSALIKKIHTTTINNDKLITLFGTGKPLRQFMYAKDLAEVIKLMIERNITINMNIATTENYSIHKIAEIALSACGAEELKIVYDEIKPDGQYRKDVSINRLLQVLPEFKATSLYDGIKTTYNYIKLNNIL